MIGVLVTPSLGESKPPPALLDEVIAALAAAERHTEALDSVFRVEALPHQSVASTDPWPPQVAGDLMPTATSRYRWIKQGNRLRVDRVTDGDAVAKQTLNSTSLSKVWTGKEWIELRGELPGEAPLYRVHARPRLMFDDDCLALFHGGCHWVSIVGPRPLSEVLRDPAISSVLDGTVLRHRVALFDVETTQAVISIDTSAPIRVQSVVLEAFDQEDTTKMTMRIGFYVDEWAEFDGMLLPKTARRLAALLSARPDGTIAMTIRRFRRLSATDLSDASIPEERFEPPDAAVGTLVQDHTLRLVYEIGSSWIVVDGVPCRTEVPIDARITGSIPALVAGN